MLMRFLKLICENDDFSDKYITVVVTSYLTATSIKNYAYKKRE